MAGKPGERTNGPAILREWRRHTGTSRARLAELLGLSDPASIYQYETGRLSLTYIHLITLQSITGIAIWDLAWPEQRYVIRALAGAAPSRTAEAQP